MMSASTGFSISGTYTGAPVALATGATAPMWSKWVWVRRIASTSAPVASIAARMRSASSPGSTTRSLSPPAGRTRKVFSAIWPTVSISTSSANALAPFAVADPLALAFAPHRHVDVVAGRDVEGEHEGAEEQRHRHRPFEQHQQDEDEDHRGGEAAQGGAFPGRRQVLLFRRGAAAAAGARAGAGFLAGAWPAAAAAARVDPATLGAAALTATFVFRLGHGEKSNRWANSAAARSRAAAARSRGS